MMLILEKSGGNSPEEKLSLLQYAIENKYEISFWYRGVKVSDPNNKKYTKQNWRFGQPAALGKSKGAGHRWMLRVWQTSGITNTEKPAWKTFLVDEMKSITVMDGEKSAYKVFSVPTGSNFRPDGDDKMMNVTHIVDPNSEPGDNKGANTFGIQEPKPTDTDVPALDKEKPVKKVQEPKPVVKKEPEQPKVEPKKEKPKVPLKPQQMPDPKLKSTPDEKNKTDVKNQKDPIEVPNTKPDAEDQEQLKENSSGFLGWVLKLDYGSKQ